MIGNRQTNWTFIYGGGSMYLFLRGRKEKKVYVVAGEVVPLMCGT